MAKQEKETPGRNRVTFTLSDFAYKELQRLSEGKGKPTGALVAIEIEKWVDSPAFHSLIKRLSALEG